jgi:cell division transport system permease protein
MNTMLWTYYFKTAFSNILNNRLIHLISIGTITISIILLASFMLLSTNLNNWVSKWGESMSMSVYLKDGTDEKSKKDIESAIKQIKGAEIKGFITKDEAMNNLKKSLGEQAGLLEGLDDIALPGSFEIIFKTGSYGAVDPKLVKASLEKIKGVDEVQYSQQWIERFQGVMGMLRVAGYAIGALLCLAVLFITGNTIKLTIYTRKEEIEIYKLVGATDWFVKVPFLIEGAIQCLAGGIAALLVLFLAYSAISPKTIDIMDLPVINLSFLSVGDMGFIILLSLLLGFAGGFISIGRFFRSI